MHLHGKRVVSKNQDAALIVFKVSTLTNLMKTADNLKVTERAFTFAVRDS